MDQSGFIDIEITTIGTGVFGTISQLCHGLLYFSVLRFVISKIAILLDSLLRHMKPDSFLGKRYYPLGYVMVAKK